MANPHRGEVQIRVGEKTYKLLFGTTAQCALEKTLKIPFAEIGKTMETVTGLRAVFWACLLRHSDHHGEFPTPDDVDDLMDEIGLYDVRTALVQAINSVVLKPSDGAKSKNG